LFLRDDDVDDDVEDDDDDCYDVRPIRMDCDFYYVY